MLCESKNHLYVTEVLYVCHVTQVILASLIWKGPLCWMLAMREILPLQDSLSQCFNCFTTKSYFLYPDRLSLDETLCIIVSTSINSVAAFRVLKDCDYIPLEPFILQNKKSQFRQDFFMPYSTILSSSSWPFSGSSPVFQCFSQTGPQCSFYVWPKKYHYLYYYEIITFLDVLVVLLLVQAQVWLVVRTNSGSCLICFSLEPPELNLPSLYPQMMTQVLFIAVWTSSLQQRALFIFAPFCTRSVQCSSSAHQGSFSTTWGKKKERVWVGGRQDGIHPPTWFLSEMWTSGTGIKSSTRNLLG